MQEAVRWIPAACSPCRSVDHWEEAWAESPGKVRLLDQTLLPERYEFVEIDELESLIDAIKRLVVRGAPAIGCAAALGMAAIAEHYRWTTRAAFEARLRADGECLAGARPTAVNLEWAVRRMLKEFGESDVADRASAMRFLRKAALSILSEDIELCRSIGRHGAKLLKDGATVLTHCNAGALATSDYGTALAPIYVATEEGRKVRVYSDETRPLLQGSRLTAWELHQAGIEVWTICDDMAAEVMREGKIDMVIVGADRIAANGDTANKIGTYGVAVLAKYHKIPFYVAAPYSTIDRSIATGAGIPIEERGPEEVSEGFGRRTAPRGVRIYNPAFDVTPHELITGYITERGVLESV